MVARCLRQSRNRFNPARKHHRSGRPGIHGAAVAQRCGLKRDGDHGSFTVANSIRLHHHFPHHLPSFTIGLAAWLTVLESLCLATGRPVYRVLFEFWLKIFGVAFGLGVVSGVVAVLCGIGLCLGYALLGASWLVRKCEAGVQRTARRQISRLAVGVLAFLVIVFAYALAEHLPILHRWIDRRYLLVFPAIGAFAATVLALSILNHDDYLPFHMVAIIFASAFGSLALSFWPYMIPFFITVDAAAPATAGPDLPKWQGEP